MGLFWGGGRTIKKRCKKWHVNDLAEQIEISALKSKEYVSNIVILSRKSVTYEVKATQRISHTVIDLQKDEKNLVVSLIDTVKTSVVQNGSSTPGQVSGYGALVRMR